MAVSKKGSRKIVVDEHEFRWRATGNDGWISVVIWPTENDDSLLIGNVGYHHLWRDNDDGSKSSLGQVIVTNRMIRKIIEHIGAKVIVRQKGQMQIGSIEDIFDVREAVRSEDVKRERSRGEFMEHLQQLDRYFQERTEQNKFSGVVLITQGDDTLFSGTYGYASRAWKIPNTLDTRFDTASITKLFTSVAILQLIDQGYLTLDTKVIDLLGLEDTTISSDVTVYHLLTHTSGIGDDADEEAGERYEDLWIDKPNYSVLTTTDMLPQFIHKPANFAPGKGCRYCNVGYILLGLVIEKLCGVAYRDHIREQIFAKVGMERTDFLHLDRVNENMAEGADPIFDENESIIGWKKNIYSFPPVGAPESGAHVTAGDLDRFLRSVQRGELLSPELTEAFLTPKVHHNDREGWTMEYGYGLWFYVDASGDVVCYQKEGINAGVSNAMRYFPKHDINVVILTNMEEGVWEPIWKVHEVVVGGT